MFAIQIIIHIIGIKVYSNSTTQFTNLIFKIVMDFIQMLSVRTPTKVMLSKVFKPLQTNTIKIFALIRIRLNTNNNILINNKQLSPTLIVPLFIFITVKKQIHIFIVAQIGNYNIRRVHHFYSAFTILTTALPIHTRFPAAIIVAHGHIIKRMNRKTQVSLNILLIKEH